MNNTTAVTNATTEVLTTTDVSEAINLFFTVLIPAVFHKYIMFFTTPFIYPEMWWLLIHLILTFVLFEFYFERHENEDLGWTAALANSVVMMFISMELLRVIYGHTDGPIAVLIQIVKDYFSLGFFSEQMVLVTLILILGIGGIATALINYYHLLPRKLAFMVSGHKTVNLLAYFVMVVTFRRYNGEEFIIDGITITALLLFGATMWLLIYVLASTKKKKKTHHQLFTPHR
ncbi:MAG: hypothetical protein ACMXYD_04785 [Candidatus Woesearchaeota archaeon]